MDAKYSKLVAESSYANLGPIMEKMVEKANLYGEEIKKIVNLTKAAISAIYFGITGNSLMLTINIVVIVVVFVTSNSIMLESLTITTSFLTIISKVIMIISQFVIPEIYKTNDQMTRILYMITQLSMLAILIVLN